MLDLCLTCSSDPYTQSSKSEKPSNPFTTPCCRRSICSPCLSRNSRLRDYCVLCQKAIEATSVEGSSAVNRQKREQQFVLGDEDDEDELPKYEEVPVKQEVKDIKEESGIHYIQPVDTLQGIALSYGVPARTLVQQNKLPLAILSTQPSVLHTRTFLMLPPGCKASVSPTPVRDEAEERRRLLVRHFQMKTKCMDPKVANYYIDQVFEARTKEAECVQANRAARGEPPAIDGENMRGGELDDAIEAYNTDLAWEAKENNKKGKSSAKFTAKYRGMSELQQNSESLLRRRI